MAEIPTPSPSLLEKLVRIVDAYPISSVLIGLCIFAFFVSIGLWIWFAKNNKTEDKRWARNASAGSFVVAVAATLFMFFFVQPTEVFARGQLKDWQKLDAAAFRDLETAWLSITPTPDGDYYHYRGKEKVKEPALYKWLVLYSHPKIECAQARFVIRPAEDDASREINIVVNLDDPALKDARGLTPITLKYQPSAPKGRCIVMLPNRRLSNEESARACRYEYGKEVSDFQCSATATASRWTLISSAFAYMPERFQQKQPLDEADIAQRLKSRDPEIRLRARQEIARRGEGALPWIERTLNESRDDALKSEALRILVQIDSPKIKRETFKSILALLGDDYEPLRSSAAAYVIALMKKGYALDARGALAWAVESAKEGLTPSVTASDASNRKSQLAISMMELHYYLGSRAYLRFEKDASDSDYKEAIEAFQKALSFAGDAKADVRYKFTLPRWGLAITYHQRLWRLPAGDAGRAVVEDALRRELQAIASLSGTLYRYPFHISTAKRCLETDLARDCIPPG